MTSTERESRIREGTALYGAGRAKEAARLLREIEFAEDERDTVEYAVWCCNLGAALAETGELSAATRLFEEAAAIHERREEWSELANVRFNLGNVSRYGGAFDQAENHYRAAHEAFGKAGSEQGRLVVLQSLGNIQLARGDYDGARERLAEIAVVFPDETKLNGVTRWSLDTLRGNLAQVEGNLDLATELFTRALDHVNGSEDVSYIAEARVTLGKAFLAGGCFSDALEHLEVGAELWQRVGHPQALQAAQLRDACRAKLGTATSPTEEPTERPQTAVNPQPDVLPLDIPPAGPEPLVMSAQGITEEKLNEVVELVRARSQGGLSVRVGDDVVIAGIPSVPDWVLLDSESATIGELETLVAVTPPAAVPLLHAARMAAQKGVEARSSGDLEGALRASAFGLRAAMACRDTRGTEAISGNLVVIETAVASELTRPLNSARPRDRAAKERMEGILVRIQAIGKELSRLAEELLKAAVAHDDHPARLRLLLSLRRLLAAGHQNQSLNQKLLPAWAGGGVLGDRPGGAARYRRTILAELAQLAFDTGNLDQALVALYEEMAHVRISELLSGLGYSTVPSDQVADIAKVDTAKLDDTGAFDALWRLYQQIRPRVSETDNENVLQACSLAVDHFEKLRILAVYAGTGSGHVASYSVSQFVTQLNRDFVVLLETAGLTKAAVEQAERTSGRAMADWMGRTHLNNRMVLREGFTGSVGEVAVAQFDEILAAAEGAGCLIAYYLSTPAGWRAWLVGPEGILANERPEGVEPLIKQLTEHLPYRADPSLLLRSGNAIRGAPLGRRQKASVDDALERLGDVLLPPSFRKAIAGSECERLAVISDGALHYVPFACLRPGGERYLVEDLEVVYWPSTTCTLLCEQEFGARDATGELPPIVMGEPLLLNPYPMRSHAAAETIELGELPGTREEAELAGRVLGVSPNFGGEAAFSTIIDRFYGEKHHPRPYAPVIHIASHAVLVTEQPEDSFVALADGPLRAGFLYSFDPGIRAGLVVLSCCQTGLGGIHPDSVVGLANAFLVAGACSIMSTLWQVPDASTNQLVQEFYAAMKDGGSVCAALRSAQLSLMMRPLWAHPLYWGAFKISGVNLRLEKTNCSSSG